MRLRAGDAHDPAELTLIRALIRDVRAHFDGRGISGPMALRLADACEMLMLDHMRTTAMNTEMRALLDQRPAINSGLIKTYTNWSARVYQFDFMNAFDDTHRNGSESK